MGYVGVYCCAVRGHEGSSGLPYVPGNAVEGYCLKCKTDTVHTVLQVEGLQVRLVRCEKCSLEEPFRPPRARTKAGLLEVAAKRKTTTTRRPRKKQQDPAQIFRQLLEGKDLAEVQNYNIKIEITVGDLVRHKIFGIGVVTTMTEPAKATITFEDGPRVMVCNKG